MSGKKIFGVIALLLAVCCLFTHRRVIRAIIKNEHMPKAPEWHVWVKTENRR